MTPTWHRTTDHRPRDGQKVTWLKYITGGLVEVDGEYEEGKWLVAATGYDHAVFYIPQYWKERE